MGIAMANSVQNRVRIVQWNEKMSTSAYDDATQPNFKRNDFLLLHSTSRHSVSCALALFDYPELRVCTSGCRTAYTTKQRI